MEKIKLLVKGEYIEEFLPPRGRKIQHRVIEGEVKVNLCSISKADAPVAIRYATYQHERDRVADEGFLSVDYRLYGNRLYKREDTYFGDSSFVRPNDAVVSETGWGWETVGNLEKSAKNGFIGRERFSYRTLHSLEELKFACKKTAKKYLLIDGEVWRVAEEPIYCIYTFGLGHNHAETCVSIVDSYNENISRDRYFIALEYDKAVAEGIRIAEARGDTNSVPDIRDARKIEVLIPEIVKRSPHKDHKSDGNSFLNALEGCVEATNSASEAAVLAMAMTAATTVG